MYSIYGWVLDNVKNGFYMEKSEMDKLKAALRQLGFDERIDFLIETGIRKRQPSFTVPYRIDMGKDVFLFDLEFLRIKKSHNYQLDKCTATLLRKIDIPNMKIEGIDLVDLEKRLKVIKRELAPEPSQPITDELYLSIFQDITALRKSPSGDQVADLFSIRYMPENFWPTAAVGRMGYDNLMDRYFVRQTFDAKAITSAADCCTLLIGEMDEKVPVHKDYTAALTAADATKRYIVTAIAIDVKTGNKLTLKSNKPFASAKEIATLLSSLDPRFFDKGFIRQHADRLKFSLKEITLLDEPSKSPMMSLRLIGHTSIPIERPAVVIAFHHPEIGPVEFLQPAFNKAATVASNAVITRMQQTLSQLGLVSQKKEISTRVIPPPKRRVSTGKRPRGGKKPG